MKSLKDCEYTAFISYAHADDELAFGWVTQFRDELERGLRAQLRGMQLQRMHLSGENGPVSGRLSEELKKRIEDSFAMIIVVHENYAQSEWCLKELEYFKSLFGDDGFRQRLYIVALSEQAMLSVSGGSAWQRLMPGGEQLWMPFFAATEPTRPLDIYMGPGLVANQFRPPFERLRNEFAGKLKLAAAAAAPPAPPVLAMPVGADAGPATASAANAPPCVVFGFVPPASAAAAAAALARLAEQGVAARQLGPEAMFTDFADLAGADHLVLAFDDAPPMMTALKPGGHLELQREAWLHKGQPAERLHWLDLRSPAPADGPPRGAAAYVAALGVATTPLDALARKLRPAPDAGRAALALGVRIYIESNRHELTLWEPLGEQIRRKWDEVFRHLEPSRVPPLLLRARGLPVDQIDSFPSLDDADGVVLLWGKKTSDALVAQIDKVERKTTPGRDAAPGIVAYLMPPQQASEPIPAWGWQVLRFDASDEERIDVVDEERDQLKRFLKKVFERRRARELAGLA